MISTLIRGGGVSLPNTTRYREEYLVDTETNEIIYPKVLPSSITIPPGNTEGVNPSLIGGIDPSSYFEDTVNLAGFMWSSNTNRPLVYKSKSMTNSGIYLIIAFLKLSEFINPAPSALTDFEVDLGISGQAIASYKGFVNSAGWLRTSIAGMGRIHEGDIIHVGQYSPISVKTKIGFIVVKGIKLFTV